MQLKITIAENLGYLILCTELQQPMRAVTFRTRPRQSVPNSLSNIFKSRCTIQYNRTQSKL